MSDICTCNKTIDVTADNFGNSDYSCRLHGIDRNEFIKLIKNQVLMEERILELEDLVGKLDKACRQVQGRLNSVERSVRLY